MDRKIYIIIYLLHFYLICYNLMCNSLFCADIYVRVNVVQLDQKPEKIGVK